MYVEATEISLKFVLVIKNGWVFSLSMFFRFCFFVLYSNLHTSNIESNKHTCPNR